MFLCLHVIPPPLLVGFSALSLNSQCLVCSFAWYCWIRLGARESCPTYRSLSHLQQQGPLCWSVRTNSQCGNFLSIWGLKVIWRIEEKGLGQAIICPRQVLSLAPLGSKAGSSSSSTSCLSPHFIDKVPHLGPRAGEESPPRMQKSQEVTSQLVWRLQILSLAGGEDGHV